MVMVIAKMELLALLTAFVSISGIHFDLTHILHATSVNPSSRIAYQVTAECIWENLISERQKSDSVILPSFGIPECSHMKYGLRLRGGGALGGREVKIKAVKKKHVASNPKPKDNDAKADGLSRSQRRKAKEEAKAGRSSQASAKPNLSALEEALEIAARASANGAKSKGSFQTSFEKLKLIEDDSQAVNAQKDSTDSSSPVEVRIEVVSFFSIMISF